MSLGHMLTDISYNLVMKNYRWCDTCQLYHCKIRLVDLAPHILEKLRNSSFRHNQLREKVFAIENILRGK